MIVVGSNSYNGHRRWRNLMESIRRRDPGVPRDQIKFVLVDDHSPDAVEMERVARDYGADYIRFDRNRGISAGWNAICRYAWDQGADWTAVLNDDILVADNWLVAMDVFLSNTKGVSGSAWPIVWFAPGDEQAIITDPATAPVRDHRKNFSSIKNLQPGLWGRPGCSGGAFSGCCFGVTREAFDAVGGFDEGFMSFYEETAFGYEALAKGFVAMGLTGPPLWHQWSATFDASQELRASDRMSQSRQRFWDKFGFPEAERYHDHRCFAWVEAKYRDRMTAPSEVTWWTPDGARTA